MNVLCFLLRLKSGSKLPHSKERLSKAIRLMCPETGGTGLETRPHMAFGFALKKTNGPGWVG